MLKNFHQLFILIFTYCLSYQVHASETLEELQHLVVTEAVAFMMVMIAIIASYKHWLIITLITTTIATIGFFSSWYTSTALSAFLVYTGSLTLLWFEVDKRTQSNLDHFSPVLRIGCWFNIFIGVVLMIGVRIRGILAALT